MESLTNTLTDEEKQIAFAKIAQKIKNLKIEPLAIFFLESSKPLLGIGKNFAYAIAPLLKLINIDSNKVVALFNSKEDIEKLISHIES